MPVSPLLLSGLIGAGSELAAGLPKLLGSKFEKEQKQRLKEMQAKEEMNLLGLTDQERAILEQRLQARSNQASAYAAAERNKIMAAGNTQGGAILSGLTAADEARAKQEVELQAAIEIQDAEKKAKDIEELRALEASVAQIRADRKATIGNAVSTGAESLTRTKRDNQYFQGGTVLAPEEIEAIAVKYGVSKEKASQLGAAAASNPEVASYVELLLNK